MSQSARVSIRKKERPPPNTNKQPPERSRTRNPSDKPGKPTHQQIPFHPFSSPPSNDDNLRPTRSFPRHLRPLLQNPLRLAQTRLALVREFGRVQEERIDIRRPAYVLNQKQIPLSLFRPEITPLTLSGLFFGFCSGRGARRRSKGPWRWNLCLCLNPDQR